VYIPPYTWNIHVPSIPTLLVCGITVILLVFEFGILKYLLEVVSYPATAFRFVHCIKLSAYKNIIKESCPSVAKTH